MFKVLKFILIIFVFTSCAVKQAIVSKSATILIKTPKMKFYDKGFINKYSSYTQVQIFQVGNLVLDLKVYEDRVCQSTFKCLSNKAFNKEFLHHSYKDSFFKDLIDKNEKIIIHRDKKNKILIKIYK